MRLVDARRDTETASTARRRRQPPLPEESLIQLWDVATGKEIRRIGMGKTRINQAVLAPDGKTLATAATDKTIRLWDLATGREIRRFGGGDCEPGHIAFSPDGTKLASTEEPGTDFPDPRGASPAPDRTDPRLGHGHGPRAPPLGD